MKVSTGSNILFSLQRWSRTGNSPKWEQTLAQVKCIQRQDIHSHVTRLINSKILHTAAQRGVLGSHCLSAAMTPSGRPPSSTCKANKPHQIVIFTPATPVLNPQMHGQSKCLDWVYQANDGSLHSGPNNTIKQAHKMTHSGSYYHNCFIFHKKQRS